MVPELWFDEEADASLAGLEADEARRALIARVNEVLDQLETDPGDVSVRRHRFQEVGLWCVVIPDQDDQWVVLWEPHPDRDDAVIIHYLGPATFP